ncbi:MAG: hypothetical protein OIF58_16570, partial [Cohaesibacter sp.]|nr:hypothetical protein [Cohaesibacter sp.]
WTQRQPPSESGGLSAYLLEDHGFRKMFFKKLMGVFSEMSFPRFDRLGLSDGGPLLIQYIFDASVSSR